jgi:uncharacterized DUF497 family protein
MEIGEGVRLGAVPGGQAAAAGCREARPRPCDASLRKPLTVPFVVATVKHANRVRSSQGRGKPNEAWRVPSIAGVLDWEAALAWVDERFEYGEARMIALAPGTRILYYVAFVDRGEVRRIISLRRANRREVKYYVENL